MPARLGLGLVSFCHCVACSNVEQSKRHHQYFQCHWHVMSHIKIDKTKAEVDV